MKETNQDDLEIIKRSLNSAKIAGKTGQSLIQDPAVASQQAKLAFEQLLKKKKELFETGYHDILEVIKNEAVEGSYSASDECDVVQVEECLMNGEAKEGISDIKNWKRYLEETTSLQNLCGYKTDIILNFYETANHIYQEKRLEEAVHAFTFLCLLSPKVSSFWIALGLALEANEEHLEAMNAFEKGARLEPSDFDPYLGLIRCSQTLKDYSKVKEILKKASENPAIKEEAEEALEYINSLTHKGE